MAGGKIGGEEMIAYRNNSPAIHQVAELVEARESIKKTSFQKTEPSLV